MNLSEPWATLLFVIAVPLVVQILRVIAVRIGKPIPIWSVQVIAGALSVGFIFLSGGFAGVSIPVYAGDPAAFVGAWLALVLAAWGPIELLYRLVLKALFEKIGLA